MITTQSVKPIAYASATFMAAVQFVIVIVILMAMLTGYVQAATESSTLTNTPLGPSAQELRAAQASDYRSPDGVKQACIGRLIFDVPRNMEWGILGKTERDEYAFGLKSPDAAISIHDVDLDNIAVEVRTSPDKTSAFAKALEDHKVSIKIMIQENQNDLKSLRRRLKQLFEIQKQPDNPYHKYSEQIKTNIHNYEKEIVDTEASIKSLNEDLSYNGFDLGLPDSFGYQSHAYLWRDQRLYTLLLYSNSTDQRSQAQLKAAFMQTLHNFRVRQPNEIPTEPGVCFPYGFIADDGTANFKVRAIMRYTDQPGVIYKIITQTVGFLGPEPTVINAASRALPEDTLLPEDEEKIARRIGPHSIKLGNLDAQQGGFVGKLPRGNGAFIDVYSVYTGYAGYKGSQVLPIITVEMLSFTKKQQAVLTSDPPAADQSLQRLDALLKSMRLRPTEPVMPELRAIRTN